MHDTYGEQQSKYVQTQRLTLRWYGSPLLYCCIAALHCCYYYSTVHLDPPRGLFIVEPAFLRKHYIYVTARAVN